MSHGPQRFRESEIRRAIKATRSAGIEIARVDINKDGGFAIIPGKASNPQEAMHEDETSEDVVKLV
jgi:hypothetical protein